MDVNLLKSLKNEINKIKIFDTHEHIIYESERRLMGLDNFIFYCPYISSDLVSAGISNDDLEKIRNPELGIEAKYNIFIDYWNLIKNTNFSRIILIALNDLYGIKGIDLDSLKNISLKMKEFENFDYYKEVLMEKCKIEYILNDLDEVYNLGISIREPDMDFYLPVMRIDEILQLNSIKDLKKIEIENEIKICSLNDFIKVIDLIFEKRIDKIYALKIAAAYKRRIFFNDSSYDVAKDCFSNILRSFKRDKAAPEEDLIVFQDYCYNYCIEKATENDLPVQIHTGLLGDNYSDIRNSKPIELVGLILKHRKTRFDIFHAGYPFTDELISMVKMYPNCYFNMCWVPGISELLYREILSSIIEIIPKNKIFGFGGDYLFIEGTYASQKIARNTIVEVLYEKIERKYFSFNEAIEFAENILNKNAKTVYMKK